MWRGSNEAEVVRTIHEALDRSITLIDIAPHGAAGRACGLMSPLQLPRLGVRLQSQTTAVKLAS
jgi:hypothetical protein